jgi:hypothetical protein
MPQPKSSFIRRAANRSGRMSRPPLVFGAMLAASLLFRCSDKSGGAGNGSCPGGACGGAGGQPIMASGGAPGVFTMTGGSAGAGAANPILIVGGTADNGPTYLCSDAGAGRECPLPPSGCADASTLTAYGHPSCTYGECSWTRSTIPCSGTCQDGHCMARRADENACVSGDASVCVLPRSECLNDEMLLYFSNPRCIDAGSGLRCATEARVVDCGDRGCSDGGCMSLHTLPN